MQTTFVSRKSSLSRLSATLFKSAACAVMAWLLAGEARAATFGWSGSGTGPGSGANTAWLTAGNWTNNSGFPTNTDIAFFGAGGSGTTIGFNFNGPPITTTNIGAIVLGAGSTVNRAIGNSSTTVGIQTRMYFHGVGGGLITNAVAARTLTLQTFAGGSGNGMTNILLNSGVIEAVGPIFINNSIGEAGGARTITKTGAGVLSLGAQNTFSGKMIINAGTVSINDENRLGNNPGSASADTLTLNGGTLLAAGNVTIDDGNRGITIGAGHGTFAASNTIQLALSRPIAGSGNLTNNGTGTLILNAVNTYSGRTILRAGVTRSFADSGFGAVPGAYVADQIIMDNNALLLNQDSEFNIHANRGITIGAGGARLTAGFARPWGVNSIIAGSGVLGIIADTTPHIVSLNGANTFTGDLIIGSSTTGSSAMGAINGSIAAGGVVRVTTNGWLLGTGVINRNVMATNGGHINPGPWFAPGTLTVNGVFSVTNATLSLDLAALTTVGSDVNDLLQVNGNLNLSGLVTVRPNALAGTLATGTYRLINYTGALTGNAANLIADAPGYSITFDTSTAGEVNMTVSGASSTVTWTGLNGPLNSPQWDVAFTTNFTDGVNPAVFLNGQNVIFDNTGTYLSGGIPLSINMVGPANYGALYPASVSVTTTNNVILTSPGGAGGKISGAATVFKSGNSIFTINTGNANFPNDYVGTTTVEGGVLRAGYTRAFGATNGPTIATNGGSVDVNNQSMGAEPFIISGAGVSNNGAIVNLTGGQNNALRYLTLAGDATVGGTARWDVRNYAQNNNWPTAFVNGGGYSLIKTGLNQVSFVDVGNVNLAKINVNQGVFQLEGNSLINNNTMDLEVAGGSTFGIWGSRVFHTKPLVLNHNARVFKDNGTTTNDGAITLAGGTAIIDVANNSGDTLVFRNALGGPGGFAKIGAGNLYLPGTNTYLGSTVVSNGTLTLQTNATIANSALIDVKAGAVLNVGTLVNPLTIGSGKTLAGAGTIVGRVTADTGANVTPGTSPGTLNVSSNLVLNDANLTFELNTANTEGGNVNDLINARDLTLSGVNNVSIIPLTPLGAGPYTLFRYTNSLTGNAANLSIGGGSRYTWTPDFSAANVVRITPAGAPASLEWAGGVSGSETLWDVNTTANWTNGAAADNFFQSDAVSFTDFSTYTNVSLVGALSPGNITVNSLYDYTFGGAGQLKTLNQLAKSGTGRLTLAGNNPELNGGITINAGLLQIGEGGTAGSVGPSAPITNNATLVFSRSDSNGLPNVIRGSGALVKDGTGVLGVAGANAFTGPVTVNAGTLRLFNAQALGNNNNAVTVNDGGQVDLGGVSQSATSQRYAYSIAGYGPDGRGALVNNAGDVGANSGISNLTLTADAAVGAHGTAGELGRLDIGGGGFGQLNGGGFRLIKLGAGRIPIRTTNTINLSELVISNGLVYSENFDFNLGTNVTVYPGGYAGSYSPTGIRRTNNAAVTLEGGGLTGGGQSDATTNVWTGPIQVNKPSFFHGGIINGNAHHFLLGEISGTGPITYLNNNSRRFDLFGTNDTFSGGWVVAGGANLRAMDGGGFGTGAITNFGTLDFVKTNAGSLAGGVYGNGLLRYAAGSFDAAVTLGGIVQQANVTVQGGGSNDAPALIFDSTADARIAGTISVGPANTGGRVVIDGATVKAGSFFLGEQNGQTGVVSHINGANVFVTNQFRIGHWPNNASTYTMDDGTFTMVLDPASDPYTTGATEANGGFYIGIDGVGSFVQNGGDVTTHNMVLDNRGATSFGLFTNTYTLNGGTLTMGRWGFRTAAANQNYQINLGAGTLAASVNWTSVLRMNLTAVPGVTVNPGANTISLNGPLSGSGGLVKDGSGGLMLNGTNTFATDIQILNGTLGGNGSVTAYTFIDTPATFAPGLSVGVFTVSNNTFGLLGTMLMEVSRSGAVITNDRLRVFGGDLALDPSGSVLIVTNIGSPLLGGEVFKLLEWDLSQSGTFASVTLPALGPNLSWDDSQLYVDGTIRVLGPPTIITGPADITAYVGDLVRFNASVGGYGPFTNQWSKDGLEISGANDTNLAFTNITLAHAGTYTFCSSNEFGGTCASATLTVLEVTNISAGLIAWWKLDEFDTGLNRTLDSTTNLQHLGGIGIQASNVVTTGVRSNAFSFNGAASNFVARINATNDALPAYQYPAATVAMWVKGSHTVQADRRVFVESSTNNNNPLFGIGTHSTMGGGPQVDIFVRNNSGGTPQIDHQRGRLAAFDGNWHHITFVDNNGNISLYVDGQWDTNIFYTRSSLTLNAVSLAGLLRGTYGVGFIGDLDDTMVWRRALNSNEAAQVHANALGGVPEITQQPVAQSIECSSNATFSVVATSIGTIRYQWFFGAAPIANATNSSLTLTGTLALAGNYSVVLTNFAGGVTSAVVALNVSDTIAPVVGVNNLVRYLTGSSVSITAAEVFNLGTSVEGCGTVTVLGATPTVFTCPGSYSVTVTAHDGNGNTNTGLATVTVIDPASTNLLAYEPFVCYTDGSLGGQNYRGTGFATGSWTIDSGNGFATNAASLRYASGYHVLASDGGRAYTPAAGFNTARADVDTAGAFSGLVDGGLVGGPNASGTLYFSFLARNASGDLAGSDDFAGLQLFDGGSEVLGIGNNWGAWAYSLFGISGDVDLTNSSGGFFSMDANTHLFVARIDYVSGGDDTVTVWMDPDISVGEGSQGNLYRRTFTGNARFNRIALRSGSNNNDNSWDFDEIRFGSGWAQVTAAGVAVTTQPANVSVQCGGSTSLSVVTAALVPPVYQWYRNGSSVTDATNATLNLTGVTTALAGSYNVVANNKYGSVTSAVATVTVTNTPSLISPAGPLLVGTESNDCGSMVLAGGSAYRWELNDATGGAGTGWDFLNVTGDINIEATSGNTFAVNLWSLNGATPGLAANWNNDTTNEFTIATPSGVVNGFAANKFTLNDANFANDLAGGVFAIEEGSLKLKFTPNHAPIATSITNNRAPNLTWKIKIADVLATLTSDVDGDARGLVSLGTSTNGATVTTNATHILYTNPNNVEDEFTYTVRDFGPAYRAGDTVRTGTGTLRLTVNAPAGTNQNAVAISFTNGVVGMQFAGIPGYSYDVQRTTNLTPPVVWTTLHNTNCPPLGLFDYIDLTPPVGQAYYRTAQP